MKHNTHHLKGDSTIPAWLWFALYNSEPNQKWTDQKEKLALEIKRKLKEHLIIHDIQNDVTTEPNNYDFSGIYSRPCN